MKLILASASPRRREILENLRIDFEIIPSNADETSSVSDPGALVCELSKRKADEVYKNHPESVVLAADTVVYLPELGILGKPDSEENAKTMLKALSGKKHTVYTGVSVADKNGIISEFEATDVYFRELSDREIDEYIRKEKPMDKAGAYGIQGLAGLFVERLEGCYFNVVGLPITRTYKILKEKGVDLWEQMT